MHNQVPGVVQAQLPDLPEVMQEPDTPYSQVVPVCHDGPVTTHELPAQLGTTSTYTAGVQPQVVLNGSRMRKRATLISTDNAFMIVARRNNAGTPSANAVWPPLVPFIYTAQTELSIATTAGTATVSVVTEDWAR